MKYFKSSHLAAALLGLSAGLAQAALVTTWSLGVDTTFDPNSMISTTGAVVPPGSGFNVTISSGNLTLRWGEPATPSGQSGLDITDSPIATIVTTDSGVPVPNISITHSNFPVFPPSLRMVTIDSNLTLQGLSTAGGPIVGGDVINATLSVPITFLETTPNHPAGASCPDGGTDGVGVNINGCGDIFVIGNTSFNFPFVYDSDGAGGDDPQTYFISFFEQTSGLNFLSPEACLAATGSSAPCRGFVTRENEATTVTFAALITSVPIGVPEPGSLALAGLGLTALAGLGRRRKTLPV